MHLKRQKTPKNWPASRKGTKYIVRPNSDLKRGIPVLVVLRDMLKLVKNKKEAKRVIHLKNIFLNGRVVKDEKQSALLFDVFHIKPLDKKYKMNLSVKGKIIVEEINNKEPDKKIAKIIDKKILKGKKIQLNLDDGRNFISDLECKTNDSVVINFKESKIEKCIPLKETSEIIVISGKHSGKRGVVKKINKEKKITEISHEGETINVLIKQIMAIK